MIKCSEEIKIQAMEDRVKSFCSPIIPVYTLVGSGRDFLITVEVLKSIENGTYIGED